MSSRRGSRRGGQAGFTLVEAMIASLVLLLGMAIATDLLLEAVRVTAVAGVRARDPGPELAADRLREDLRTARPPGGFPVPVWTSLPLGLDRPYAPDVTWDLEGDRLVRVAAGPGGPVSRPYLDGVVSARWRTWPPGRYEVLVIAVRESPAFVSAARGRMVEARPVTIRLLVAPRGEGDGW